MKKLSKIFWVVVISPVILYAKIKDSFQFMADKYNNFINKENNEK